jgi:GTP pyrophosphokinase
MIQVAELDLDGLQVRLKGNQANEQARARLQDALQFALEAHGAERRPSGETYVEHGSNVAVALSELGIEDPDAVVAALLHDVLLPHTGINEKTLIKRVGRDVTGLIKSIRTLDNYAKQAGAKRPPTELDSATRQDRDTLEAIRKALLSIIEGDIRIIVIRMVDCLQDLRRASDMPRELQQQVAYEALYIYAPLANRLGIWHLKWQLEDIAFRYMEPEKYRQIARHVDEKREVRAGRVERAAARLQRRLRDMGIKAVVTGRPKHIYSIYRKMIRKQLDFNHIYDIQALRVVIEPNDPESYLALNAKQKDDQDRALCYQVLGVVHDLWEPIRGEFDDYIGSPKPNGYKSLHTAVIENETNQKLEVQIRSMRMHEEAERGIAAHWAYKEQTTRVSPSAQRQIQNLRELLVTIQDDDDSVESIADVAKLEERVHVLTPTGEVLDLPAGATPIDFAYQIHTRMVGHRCRGARVNGKMVTLDYRLKSGDMVEIITGKREAPNRDWMNPSLGYTGSSRTRSKIRQWFRQQEREQNVLQGREVIQRELKRLALQDVFGVEDIAAALKFDDVNEFLSKVGFGDIQTAQITGAIALMKHSLRADDQELLPLLTPSIRKPKGLTVDGVGGLHTRIAGCCQPIAPQPIIGYITRGEGITIHSRDCKQLRGITDRERLIDVSWGNEAETHPVPIVVTAYRRGGLIEDMVTTLRGQQIKVPRTKLVSTDTTMTVYMIAEVTDITQLNWVLTKLANMPKVIEARRQHWS